MPDASTRSSERVPYRPGHHEPRRVGAPTRGDIPPSGGRSAILDGTKCALRLPLEASPSPPPDDDPCARAEHDHSDRPDGLDLPCALAGFFIARAAPYDRLWLWTGTHDPKRLPAGRGPLAVRDRVGVAAAAAAASTWYEWLRAEDHDVSVLYGMEAHKSGARHAHALVATHGDFRYRRPGSLWYERFGFNRFEPVRSAEAAGRYTGKYVTKELGVIRLAFVGGKFE